jgi:hypothetical protein
MNRMNQMYRMNHMNRINRMLFATVAFALSSATTADADVLTVALDGTGDYTTIQAAIDAAVTGDEVVLQPGIYNQTFDYLGKGLVVRSAEGPLTTRIDRNGAGGTVVTANGTPEGTRLEGIGFYVASGIMLDCDNANLVGDNLRFIGCSNEPFTIDGSSTIALTRTQVVSCTSPARIGAGTVTMEDSAFRSGTSGGLRITGGTVTMDRVDFQDNSAGAGGAIRIEGNPNVLVQDSSFYNHNASSAGGSIYASGTFILRLLDCVSSQSTVARETGGGAETVVGGFIASYSGSTTMERCQIIDAQVRRASCCSGAYTGNAYGGAIFCESGILQITDSQLIGCRATRTFSGCIGGLRASGGAIYATSSNVSISSTVISSCRVENSSSCNPSDRYAAGGAVASYDGSLELDDVQIDNCTDTQQNASIYAIGLEAFSATACRFESSDRIYLGSTGSTSSTIEVIDTEFVSTGELVFDTGVNGRDVMIQGCSFETMSKGIQFNGLPSSLISVTECDFVGLTGGDGSAIDSSNSDVLVLQCLFSGNTPPSIEATNNFRMPLVASSIFCGSILDEISGPWVDKGGNVFDADCTADCDGDGLPDDYEIQSGLEADCNGNGLPDSCESGGDCDGDGILDSCAIADGSFDCNMNGIPDECEADCDGDGLLDSCAIADGAEDCNGDGVPDACQLASGEVADANNDGILDVCQSLDFTGLESEIVLIEDRILDSTVPATAVCYRVYATFSDLQGTLTGVFGDAKHPMLVSAPSGFWQDGLGGDTTAMVQCDESGMFPDLRYDSWLTIGADCASGNMVLEEGIDFTSFNTGGALSADDGIVFITPDEPQGDAGKAGRVLLGQFTSTDGSLPTGTVNLLGQNADGTDWIAYDIEWPEPPLVDCNGNGIHDAYDLSSGTSRDCDGSGLPDECEYDELIDCNGNGISDLCDVADGTSGDADGDFVPDECECLGDTNRDGLVNVYDIIEVILHWGETGELDADVSGDGMVDGLDLSLVLQGYGGCL